MFSAERFFATRLMHAVGVLTQSGLGTVGAGLNILLAIACRSTRWCFASKAEAPGRIGYWRVKVMTLGVLMPPSGPPLLVTSNTRKVLPRKYSPADPCRSVRTGR